ncbi:MAG: polysaccharide deacetylase family protein, partial [Candidatus Moranbacteria bacterium]|nr:polysaccharide deacetylase family protein [Candidatus Moranbacteria bacterium]
MPSYIDHGSRSKNKIALTFDADMTPFMLSQLNSGHIKSHYNKEIVDVLRQEKVAATIFMTGLWVEKYPDVTKELFNDPLFEIANHSYSHPGFTPKCFTLPSVPVWGKDQEFIKSQEIIKNITGVYPKFFRFPGGCYDKEDVDLANKHGLTVVGWDAAGDDSFNNNLNSVINNIRTRTQNGSIILLHFNGNKNAPHTVQALKESINYLKEKGFVFV